MAINFPTSLDNFSNPSSSDAMNNVTTPHATQHANVNDAIEALEAKVGVNSSAVTTSHDYKLAQLTSTSNVQHGSMKLSDGAAASPAYGYKSDVYFGTYYDANSGNLLQPCEIFNYSFSAGAYNVPLWNIGPYGHSFSNTEGIFVFNYFDDDTILHEGAWGFECSDDSFELGWFEPDDPVWNSVNETAWYVEFDTSNQVVLGHTWYALDTTGYFEFDGACTFSIHRTTTTAGTTGNRTINNPSGTVNVAAGNSSITVTNNLVGVGSYVFAVVRTNDTTAVLKNVVCSNGSFVINLTANATAETSIAFWVLN